MQSSKKVAKCTTPLILNRILPKCHPEIRIWVITNLKELRVIFICTKDLRDMTPATHILLIGLN